MSNEVLKFIVSFIGGLLWYRILFAIVPIYFKRPLTRSVLKLRWHHLHWGIVLIVFGVMLLLLSEKSSAAIILFGIGLGFVIDLFIPSLQFETNREEELAVYRNSLKPTLFLAASIVIVITVLSYLNF